MVVALPRREAPRVGGPHALQRHGRRATPRRRAVEVADQVVVAEDGWIGNRHLRLAPEPGPPGRVGRSQRVPSRIERRAQASLRQRQRIGIVHRRRHGDRVERAAAGAPRAQGDDVAHPQRRLLHVPLQAGLVSEHRGRVAQPGDALTVRACGGHSPARHHRRRQEACRPRGRTRDAHQCDGLRRAEERLRTRAAREVRAALRRRQIQFERLEALSRVERDLDSPRRDLARVWVAICAVEHVIDIRVVLLSHLLDEVRVGEELPAHAVRRALVPEIAAVERQLERRVPSPQQSAHQAVAEGHRFVPCFDRRGEGEVQIRGGQTGPSGLRRLRRVEHEHRAQGQGKRESSPHRRCPPIGPTCAAAARRAAPRARWRL